MGKSPAQSPLEVGLLCYVGKGKGRRRMVVTVCLSLWETCGRKEDD